MAGHTGAHPPKEVDRRGEGTVDAFAQGPQGIGFAPEHGTRGRKVFDPQYRIAHVRIFQDLSLVC